MGKRKIEFDNEELLDRVKKLPKKPGVYLMKDAKGKVIYVGKAKVLRNRVKSYFTGQDERASIPFIVARINDIEVIVTESEHHAFLLERDLITKYKPRYNIRLKDDKAFLSVRIDKNAPWPRLELVRRPEQDGADYYGPYVFSYELRTVLELIKKVVPLRTCRDGVFYNRQRPCLEYQIKRCAGPCVLPVDREEYGKWLNQAGQILSGKTDELERELERSMEKASEELRFEDAARDRDRLEQLKNFSTRSEVVSFRGENRDAFALYREERLAVLSVLRVRNGRISESHNFCLEQVEVLDDEILRAGISQYYSSGRDVPEEVLIPFEFESQKIIREELSEVRGRVTEILVPKRGLKYRLLGLAELNAKEHFIGQFDRESRYQEVAEAIARICELEQMPRRIECVDISNIQGSSIVGGLVSFYDGQPDKSRYRQYKISFEGKPDDFASIEEVISRRLKRDDDLPDLLIIDGGKGQLERALKARDERGVSLDIVSLAKIRDDEGKKRSAGATKGEIKVERVFLPGRERPVPLDLQSASAHFLQRVRDEAHRFVIEYHRKVRGKKSHQSKLDTISGIGPERRKRLLKTFGSVKGIKGASLEEIAKAGRMPKSLAKKVLESI